MLQMIYFAHFLSQFSYDIISRGSSSSLRNVLIVQTTAIRIMLRLGPRSSCREGLKKLDILQVPCLHIYAVKSFAVKNSHIHKTNTSLHGTHTRQQNNLHIPSVRLSSIQGSGYWSVKILNQLPQNIFKFHHIHIFQILLWVYLVKNALYSIVDFCCCFFNTS
jgi:hypothetical protein